MPLSRDDLLIRLDELGIKTTTVEHPAVFTVAESQSVEIPLPGAHTKNLFLKDERGTIKVDGTKKPMTIDLLINEGSDAKKTQLGIFEVTGDSLKAGFGDPGTTERPTDFSGTVGFVAVMKKQKKG